MTLELMARLALNHFTAQEHFIARFVAETQLLLFYIAHLILDPVGIVGMIILRRSPTLIELIQRRIEAVKHIHVDIFIIAIVVDHDEHLGWLSKLDSLMFCGHHGPPRMIELS